MSKKRKHSNSRASDFFDYSGGKTRGKDRNAFERRLQKDPFEAEAAKGLEMVSRDEMEEDLRAASQKILRRTRRKNRIVWYSAAAAVASLMIVATIFFNVDDGSLERYRTAPEFQEAGQEQPSALSMDKKETRKDVIPDAEAMKGEEEIAQENLVQPEANVDQKEAEITTDNVTEALAPGAARDVNPRESETEEQELARESETEEQELARKLPAQDVTGREIPKEEKEFAMEMSEIGDIPVAGEKQDVTPQAETSRTKRTEREAFAVPAAQPLPSAEYEEEVTQQLQGQVAGVNVSQNLQGQVSGVVYSADDLQPLPGVSVSIKGTDVGTVSDTDGIFTLNNTDVNGGTLVARSIGMQTTEMPLDNGHPLEIAMVPDAMQLDEVVVVAHGTTKKASLTSTVSKVEPDAANASEYITSSPVDGIVAYKQYIDSALVYPTVSGSAEKQVVVLKFSVTPDGRPFNFEEIRSPGAPFTQEAIRVITGGPDWVPTTRDGIYVDDQVRLRIVFRPTE